MIRFSVLHFGNRGLFYHSFLGQFDPAILGDIYVNREYGRYLHFDPIKVLIANLPQDTI
jgi:hypothetical protein